MASVDDPNSDRRQYKNELRRVREAVENGLIPEADGDAILALGDHLIGTESTDYAKQNMASCRKVAIKAAAVDLPPLVEWDRVTFDRFIRRMKHADFPEYADQGDLEADDRPYLLNPYSDDGSWSEGYLRNTKAHLKNFLVGEGHEWAEDIKLGAPPKPSVERDDLLDQAELDALWEVADPGLDECIVALPLTTWQRNAVIRSFRVGDVTFPDGKRTAKIAINEDASGRKNATGERPLTWATGPVQRLLDKHYWRDAPDFEERPLLYVRTDAGSATKGEPLSANETLNRRLRTLAERADLDRDRWDTKTGRKERTISAHTLRYTGATRAAISDEYKEATVKAWGGWNMSSKQLDRYVQVVEEDVLAAADAAHGIDADLPERPQFDTCPKCGGAVEEWHRACPTCATPLTEAVAGMAESIEAIHDDATEAAIEATEAEAIEDNDAARGYTADPGALAARVAELEARLAEMDAN